MSIQDLGSLGEFTAALATIATLVYLAIQIKQNTSATRSATLDQILAQWREHIRETLINNPDNLEIWRRGLADSGQLSDSEQARFAFMLSAEQLFIENMIQQSDRGNISEDQLLPWLNYFSQEIRTPGGSAWWKDSSSVINSAFVARMDHHLERTSSDPTLIESLPMLNLQPGPSSDA